MGRGILSPVREVEKYQDHIIARTHIYPDPFYVVIISRVGDSFYFPPIEQTSQSPCRRITAMCVHRSHYTYAKVDENMLGEFMKKIQNLTKRFESSVGNCEFETIQG